MQTLNRHVLCVFMGLVSIGTAAAQTSEEDLALVYGDKSNVSIATGSQQPISKAPSSATVITAQDIQAMGATDLDQVMESVPGVHVSMQHVALNPIYSFRGIFTKENPQVLMLVNGSPITNVFWGDRSQLWGGMPLENVERIEVIRGPGSALYGADAFSGVINVITKTSANINGAEYGVRGGSFNTSNAYVQYGGKLGALDSAFYLRAGNTDGSQGVILKDAVGASGPLSTDRKAIDASADLSKDAWRFRAAYQERDVGIGAGLGGALDPNSRGHATRLYLDLNYDQANWAPNWDVSGVAGYYNIREHGNPAYTLVPAGVIPAFPNGMIGDPGHSEQHPHGSISAFYTGFEQHRVRIGTGFEVDDLYATTSQQNFTATFAPSGTPPMMMDVTGNSAVIYEMPHKRTVEYAFAQDEWSIAKDWTLTAGVRNDHYSDFGGTTNPRLALVWDAAYNLEVKAMHGTAFRAPSFSEMYSINNPVTIGSPNIKPEHIVSDELAFSWQQTTRLKSNLNFFHYRMSNIILPVGAAPAVYQNAGDQTGRGVEWEETFDATSSLRLTGNYSWQHSIDDATGQDAGMAPHRHLFARSDWRFAPLWQFDTTVNHVADRMREPGDTRPQIPDYTTVDLTLRREKFAGDWNASAMVTNLFGSNALEPTFLSSGIPSDLPLPGRALYVQVQHKL
jgi:outer membrane receptor for ferrienterochelin and colicins